MSSGAAHYFYIVSGTGTGVYMDGYRPNIPDGIGWVGQVIPGTKNQWIIRTTATSIPGYTAYTEAQAQTFCTAHGLDYDSIVATWYAS